MCSESSNTNMASRFYDSKNSVIKLGELSWFQLQINLIKPFGFFAMVGKICLVCAKSPMQKYFAENVFNKVWIEKNTLMQYEQQHLLDNSLEAKMSIHI